MDKSIQVLKATTITFVLVLAISTLATSVHHIPFPQNAYAQQVTIETSADSHANKFFGESVLQVVIADPAAENGVSVQSMSVDIDAEPDSGSGGSISIAVPETSASSGRFEFFLVHEAATAVTPADLDPVNTQGVEGDGSCTVDCAPFVTFGPSADLDVDSDLYEDTVLEITTGEAKVTIDYEKTLGILELDRTSYGTTSIVHIFVKDQDANLNPFERDEFTVDPDSGQNDDLFSLGGGIFQGVVVFKETGDGSAVFEGKYQLGSSIIVNSKSLVLTVFEKSNYKASLNASENDSNATDEVSFTVGDTSGAINDGGGSASITWDPTFSSNQNSYKLGESASISITDPDANLNNNVADSITLQVSSSVSHKEIIALETGDDSGEFTTTLLLTANTSDTSAIAVNDNGDTVTVQYTDRRPADYSERISKGENPEKDFVLKFGVSSAEKAGVETASLTLPELKDVTGRKLTEVRVGEKVMLSTTVVNNNDASHPFMAIFEVRDANDVTVLLAIKNGILSPNGSSDVSIPWEPEMHGPFQVRSFAVSDSAGDGVVEVLSHVSASLITVA